MVTFHSALQKAMQLDLDSREKLIEILRKLQSEKRRHEILKEAGRDRDEFFAGNLQSYTAAELIAKLESIKY